MTSAPTAATLADVYAIDFGRRTADKAAWIELLTREARLREHELNVVEIGVGDGRVPALVVESTPVRRWVGIDPSAAMLAQFERRPFNGKIETLAVLGDAADSDTWATVARAPGSVDVVLCAYSTICLMPPNRQASMLRHMAYAVRPGGLLAIECFIPSWVASGEHVVHGACGNPDGDERVWGRIAKFVVNAATRHTHVERTYGPIVPGDHAHGVEPRFIVGEDIWWHHPTALRDLALDAGWLDARVQQGPPNAPGYFMLIGRT